MNLRKTLTLVLLLYTYKLSFIPTTNYGSVPAITSNTDIETRYLFARVGFERMLTNKLSLICGLEWDNDWLFNSMRRQDFGGLFLQQMLHYITTI